MSTKKRLIKATMFTRQGIYGHGNYIDKLVPLRHTLDCLIKKQYAPITKDLLEKNGFEVLTPAVALPFKTWRLKDHPNFWFDEYVKDRDYNDDGTFGLVKKGSYLISFASTRTDLKTVADLEDALDLCGIDKEIEI